MIALAPSHVNQLSNYTSWLERNKFLYKILTPKDDLSGCSMLILCGGPDVGTAPERDINEVRWFNEAYGRIPVLGICRGLQLANVVLGGSLHRDLSETPVKHTSNKKEIAGEPNPLMESSFHDVIFNDGKRITVNSRHHQGIKELAEGLESLGVCSEDNLCEIMTGKNSLFVQWHPEREDAKDTEAENLVVEWIKKHELQVSGQQLDWDKSALTFLLDYMNTKNFSVISNERCQKLNEKYNTQYIQKLLDKYPSEIKITVTKDGKRGIKKLK